MNKDKIIGIFFLGMRGIFGFQIIKEFNDEKLKEIKQNISSVS